MYQMLGNRRVVIARELTKKFETIIYDDLEHVTQSPENIVLKGEFVIVLEGLTRNLKAGSVA
ncbi:MAG: hypothetical protein U5R06_21755 [candidate division KSB1 bacterium]|nr:hypothetical protein [candidate division KSB1 bacterium]